VVWNNEYRVAQGRPQKKNVSSRRQSPPQKKKRSPTKRKPAAGSKKSSRRRTTRDLSERRRQARERQKQAEKRARKRVKQESNIIAFPRQSQPSQPVTAGSSRSGIERSFLLILRLLILAVGIGAIAGTVLSLLDRDKYLVQSSFSTATEVTTSPLQTKETPSSSLSKLPLKQQAASLKQTFQTLASQQPQLNPAAFVVDLDSGKYVNFQGESRLSAASMIKIPILIAFFQAWEEGKLQLDESLTITEAVKAGGSGKMQNQPVGTEYLALEAAAKMIIDSDNTAANMIIKRLGGKEALNRLFVQWGLEHTRLRNPLPDFERTNTTSPKELVTLLAQLSQGELVSARSRDRIFQILGKTQNNSLLVQGLDQRASIAHKTGSIASLVGDVGIIDSHTGKRYLVAVMVERPPNDNQAKELIRRYSQETYQYFQKQEKNSFIK